MATETKMAGLQRVVCIATRCANYTIPQTNSSHYAVFNYTSIQTTKDRCIRFDAETTSQTVLGVYGSLGRDYLSLTLRVAGFSAASATAGKRDVRCLPALTRAAVCGRGTKYRTLIRGDPRCAGSSCVSISCLWHRVVRGHSKTLCGSTVSPNLT